MSEAPFDANEWRRFDPQSQKQILQAIENAKKDKKIWYCKRGRDCDGFPHDDIDYNHARSDQWPPAGSDWFTFLIKSGRGTGKALDVSTPILTDGGWKNMGELVEGDVVYDETGKPATIEVAWKPYTAQTMYRVHFSDGSSIDADAEHLWVTWEHRDRKQYLRHGGAKDRFPADWADRMPITTEEMYQTQSQGKRNDRNHCIPLAGPIDAPEKNLPISPYVLGAWLGDGSSGGAEFTVHDDDYQEISALLAGFGAPLTGGRRKPEAKCQTYSIGTKPQRRDLQSGTMLANDSLHSRLREANLVGNKHVPDEYFTASAAQRLALLQGLMDTDGYADERLNTVEFCSSKRGLAEDVLALARSLSERPVLKVGRATIGGVDYGPKYRVTWRPSVYTPFLLARKASKIKKLSGQGLRQRHRMITKVEPIASTEVRCITVDSPNSMYLAGRALIPTHNTRSGAEWVRSITSRVDRIALVGRRGPDVRGTMIEGESGLINVCERAGMSYEWYPSRKEFVFGNGARAFGYSAEEPDTLRGPQHGAAWLDEPAHMPLIRDVWDNLVMGLRLTGLPGGAKVLCTSTPLPMKWLKELQADPRTVTVTVSTHKNLANLDETFKRNVLDKYEGTRLGRQELYGEILEDVEGALWTYSIIEPYRNKRDDEGFIAPEDMDRIVVGVDPAGTSSHRRDETGIIVVGKRGDHFYVIDDYSGHYTPEGWARAAYQAYDKYNADAVIAEKNYGGEMVLSTLRNHRQDGNAKLVHSRRGKALRAEPVVGLYEQGRVHHYENLDELETQMTEWVVGDDSPDRVDGLVHAVTELSGKRGPSAMAVPTQNIGRDDSRRTTSTPFGRPVSGLVDHRGQPLRSW